MNRARKNWRRALLGGALAVLALSAALAAPTQAAATERSGARASILGGSTATTEEWPWAAFVLALDQQQNGFSCSGTVIAPRVILTAGHCVEDLRSGLTTDPSQYTVVTGSSDIRDASKRQLSKVSRAVVYPGFSRTTLHGDAGLLILATPVSAPALATAEPTDTALLETGVPASIAGWGLSGARAKPQQSPILRQAQTSVQSSRYCSTHGRAYYPFFAPTTQFCTTTPPAFTVGTCHGDSGGPALAFRSDGTAVQIGITSLGAADCDPKLPDVFTRVDVISTWAKGWVSLVESGAPLPSARPAHLPTMGKEQAAFFVREGLSKDLGNAFRHAGGRRIRCERVDPEKARCGVVWFRGGTDYFGYVTVFYAYKGEAATWDYRYTIHWVNDRCYFRSDHRSSCKIHTRRRR